ncbi:MAG: 4Fe-4S binding protein [Nitrospirae bacterium]|nr:MAG: 4Fe-4S binding protein [Nitrospirota bacterium]
MKRFRIIFLGIVALSFAVGQWLNVSMSAKTPDEAALLKDMVPDARFSAKGWMPPHYSSEGLIAFNTYDLVPSIRGYAGPIKLLVVMDRSGFIRGVRIIGHRETKNYIHFMESSEYLARLAGKHPSEPFQQGRDIDAISRATVSVDALAKTLKGASALAASSLLGLDVKGEAGAGASDYRPFVYGAFFVVSFAFYFATRKTPEYSIARDISLAVSIVVLGIYLSSPFSVLHVFSLILGGFSSSALWYTLIISVALSVIAAGRFYCGWLCQFGALCEFAGRMPVSKWEMSSDTDEKCRRLKYVVLGLVTALVLISGRPDYGNYEVYVTLFSFHGSWPAWLLVFAMLIANLKVKRFWCRYLCPVAALSGLFSRQDAGYVSRSDCPMSNTPNPHISECIRCNRCYKGSLIKP